MQDDQQLPRAPAALTYSVCFSSLSALTGSCLSVTDLGFRVSDMCQMSFGVCAVQIFPLDILLCVCVCFFLFILFFFFLFCFECFVAHKPHFPSEWLGVYIAAQYTQCSIFSIVLHALQPPFSPQHSSSIASCCTHTLRLSVSWQTPIDWG